MAKKQTGKLKKSNRPNKSTSNERGDKLPLWMIIAAMLIPMFIGVAMFVVYVYTSPQRALSLVNKALEKQNASLFAESVDLDEILNSFYLEVQRNPDAKTWIGEAAARQIQSRPIIQLLPDAKRSLLAWVQHTELRNLPAGDPAMLLHQFSARKWRFAGLIETKEKEKKASLWIKMLPPGAKNPLEIELLLRHNEENWQVIEIPRLLQLLERSRQP